MDAIARAWRRARELDPLGAFAHLPDEPPVAATARGDAPLAGIAVGVKDIVDTADMPTAYGTSVMPGHRPDADATIVRRLRDLGATVLGKTATTEFAFRQPSATRNPWNPQHTPGGSSSGSAASVAAGIVPLAIGTQTLGSVIRPAAFCGVVGFKPSFGVLPRDGVHPLCSATDTVGLFARSVADVERVFRLLAPDTPPPDADVRPARIGVLAYDGETVEPAQRAALETAVAALGDAGHVIVPYRSPVDLDDATEVVSVLLAGEAVGNFGAHVDRFGDRLSRPILDLVAHGRSLEEGVAKAARERQEELARLHAESFTDIDVILTIPAAGEAPHGLESTGDPRFCLLWSLVRAPAITLPVAVGPRGLPLGVQLVARPGDDHRLLRAAASREDLARNVRWPGDPDIS